MRTATRRLAEARAERALPDDPTATAALASAEECTGLVLGGAPTPVPSDDEARATARTAAASGDLSGWAEVAATPKWTDEKEGFQRAFFDPCAHMTASQGAITRAITALGGGGGRAFQALVGPDAGLESTLFAPWVDTDNLRAELKRNPGWLTAGAQMPWLEQVGLERVPKQDDPAKAAAEVDALTGHLERLESELLATASPEGRALLQDLGLVARLKQEVLVARARLDLEAGRTKRALAQLERALDVTDRRVGPGNSASAFVLLAHAQLASGRTREALDALRPVVEAVPEAVVAAEWVGDLAVLEGMGRAGDSKEN